MREDPDDRARVFDGGDDFPSAATRAARHFDVEHALQVASPAHADGLLCVLAEPITGLLYRARHDRHTQAGVRGEHTVEADQMQAWTRRQGSEALQNLSRSAC